MGLGQVLAVRALALVEVRHGVEAQPVDAHVEPEVERVHDAGLDVGVVVVEVGLVGVEAVPEVGLGHRVPRPVRRLEVLEDDAGVGVAVGVVAPHVEVALGRPGRRVAGPLEPRVLVGRVVDDELGDHADVAVVGGGEEAPELAQVAVVGVDRAVVGDVVAVVAQRRRVERQQPDRRDAEVGEVVEALGEPVEVADAVAVGVGEGPDVELVDDRVAVPVGRSVDPRRDDGDRAARWPLLMASLLEDSSLGSAAALAAVARGRCGRATTGRARRSSTRRASGTGRR